MFKKYRIFIFYFLLVFLPVFKGCDNYTLGFPFPFWDIPIDGASFNGVYSVGMFLLNVVLLFLLVRFILRDPQRMKRFVPFTCSIFISFIIFVMVFVLGYFGGMDWLEEKFYLPAAWVCTWLSGPMPKVNAWSDFTRHALWAIIWHGIPRLWFIVVALLVMPAVSWVRKNWILPEPERIPIPSITRILMPLILLQFLFVGVIFYVDAIARISGSRPHLAQDISPRAVLQILCAGSILLAGISLLRRDNFRPGLILFFVSIFFLLPRTVPFSAVSILSPCFRPLVRFCSTQEVKRVKKQKIEDEKKQVVLEKKEIYGKLREVFMNPQQVVQVRDDGLVLENGLVIDFLHFDTKQNFYQPYLDQQAFYDFVENNIIQKGIGVNIDIGSYALFEKSATVFSTSPDKIVGSLYAQVFFEGELLNDKFIKKREELVGIDRNAPKTTRVINRTTVTKWGGEGEHSENYGTGDLRRDEY